MFINFDLFKQVGVVQNDISDHFPIFGLQKPPTRKTVTRYNSKMWNYNRYTINKFQNLIASIEPTLTCRDSAQVAYSKLHEELGQKTILQEQITMGEL